MNDVSLKARLYLQGFDGVEVKSGIIRNCEVVPDVAVIPHGILGLADGCLSGQLNLEKVFIPTSVNFIGEGVFSNCPNLRLIIAPYSLSDLEDKLLCGTVAVIEYKG